MRLLTVPLLLTSGPFLLGTLALARTATRYKQGHIRSLPLWAVWVAWLVTVYAAYVFLYYTLTPSPDLPPWKDPETLDLGLVSLVAPVGFAATWIAARRGVSKWEIALLVAALLVLFFVGLLEGASV